MDDAAPGAGLHVAFVAPEAWSAVTGATGSRTGGAETQQTLLAAGLRRRGRWTTLLVAAPPGADAALLPGWVLPSHPMRERRSLPGFLADSLRLLQAMASTGAGVFIQRCAFHDAPRVALFAGLLGARFVFWVGAEYNVRPDWLAAGLSPLRRAAYLWALRSADAVVCQTEAQARALRSGFGLPSTVIPNAVAIPGTLPERRRRTDGRPTALWGGRINANKRPGILLDLARSCPEWRFVVAAVRERGREAEHGDFLEAASGVPGLEVLEDLPQVRFLELAASADLALNTSRLEGFPNTLLECFAAGVPALTLGVDPDGVLSAGGLGWVCRSVEEASQTLHRLARDPDALGEAGRRARRYVLARHAEEGVLDRLERLLDDLEDRR